MAFFYKSSNLVNGDLVVHLEDESTFKIQRPSNVIDNSHTVYAPEAECIKLESLKPAYKKVWKPIKSNVVKVDTTIEGEISTLHFRKQLSFVAISIIYYKYVHKEILDQ